MLVFGPAVAPSIRELKESVYAKFISPRSLSSAQLSLLPLKTSKIPIKVVVVFPSVLPHTTNKGNLLSRLNGSNSETFIDLHEGKNCPEKIFKMVGKMV